MRNGVTAMFLALNRGKKSFTVDLRTAAGREAVARLAATADVFVENFRPGVVRSMGLDAETLTAAHPGLIYVSITGYGPDGPMVNEPAYDTVVQGQTGMIARQVGADGRVDKVRSYPVDKLTGMFAAQSVLAALYARQRTGRGCTIDVPMFDAAMYYLWSDVLAEMTFADGDYTRVADTWKGTGVTETADGRLVHLAISMKEIQGTLRAVGLGELTGDERFASLGAYLRNKRDFDRLTKEAFARWPTAEILDRLRAEGVAASAVLQPAEVMADERLTGGDFFLHWEHAQAGSIRQPRPPARFDHERQTPTVGAPMVGEHTEDLLAELGYGPDRIAELTKKG